MKISLLQTKFTVHKFIVFKLIIPPRILFLLYLQNPILKLPFLGVQYNTPLHIKNAIALNNYFLNQTFILILL